MNVQSILNTAETIVLEKRGEEYGKNSHGMMMRRTAAVWSGILDHEIQPQQVALMMAGLKLVRASQTPGHEDSYVDGCGYTAIAADIIGEATHQREETLKAAKEAATERRFNARYENSTNE